MHFVKMREAGIEYVCVDCSTAPSPPDAATLSKSLAGHLTGPFLLLYPCAPPADVCVEFRNPDGTVAEGYGDGLRCVAAYLHEHGKVHGGRLRIDSAHGTWGLELSEAGGKLDRVRIDMGLPTLEAARIPTRLPGNPPVDIPMTWPDTMHNVTCVGVGEPHAVVFVRDLNDDLVKGVGPEMAHHPVFPQQANVAFVKIERRNDVRVRMWSRTNGERVNACGTACAVVVAGTLTGRTDRLVTVHMQGGDLTVEWARQPDEHLYLSGPGGEKIEEGTVEG